MSIVNRLKAAAEEHGPKLVEQAKSAAKEHGPKVQKAVGEAVQKHSPKVQEGIDKAAKLADEKTGHKHSDKIQAATGKLHEGVDKAATVAEQQAHKAERATETGPVGGVKDEVKDVDLTATETPVVKDTPTDI